MPLNAHTDEVTKDDGTKAEVLSVEFTNGSLQQLRDLGMFFKVQSDDPAEVLKLAISFLQNLKDRSLNQDKKGSERAIEN